MQDLDNKSSRSYNMSRIGSRNTKPELRVRSVLHGMGYRFRLNRSDLPGKPDIVLPKYRTVILVHGCFWHRHQGCKYTTNPGTNTEFWVRKFAQNVARDIKVGEQLEELGWRVIVIWECETRDREYLENIIRERM